ncbi:helix-turn-helix domain-containing protein [Paenibacillus alvei]|uniref:Helix-turn-helix domain-containing protein n=1 Tax=Paenibacillus alvei TaxID=44250 RepID=A0ABT4H7X0_PAEAL|nr:S24 family peptidase [Paenibacillus alvei]EJW17553.1 putative repressor LexA [Paenibacillus alvei DSM 29]MCY9539249.1 helix-turn-helix domain-containing protein [Paenibacillus alvei]MCY9705800.1 helix-turn-helix domain-containing protein [Paenibacillus alvei]MCY9737115.1 helix-turn-helix domain-containing protein [Paenibacillus alvei]MCY9753505.1 helix-turn-helix domain-containing protein [Paenibacillus alvei]
MDNLDSIGKRIRHLRVKNKMTQEQLASSLEMSPANISSYERDKSIPPSDTLSTIADILHTTTAYLLLKTDNPELENKKSIITQSNLIPLIGSICAGNGIIADELIEEYIMYPFHKKSIPDFALRVQGNSMMNAGIHHNDIVYLKKANWAEYNGQIVAVIVGGEEGSLKRMRWSQSSPYIHLEPENKDYETLEVLPSDIRVCGLYMGHFHIPEEGYNE